MSPLDTNNNQKTAPTKIKIKGGPNDIYTALLGFSALALAATAGMVLAWTYRLFDGIF